MTNMKYSALNRHVGISLHVKNFLDSTSWRVVELFDCQFVYTKSCCLENLQKTAKTMNRMEVDHAMQLRYDKEIGITFWVCA